DINGMASSAYDTPYLASWREGINQWRIGHKAAAAKYFVNVANHASEISPWMASAASYWAYRSYEAAGNEKAAAQYLNKAAEYPRSFYGLIARKQLKMPAGLDNQPVELTDSDVLQMVGDQPVRRILALVQTGANDLAENELRVRFAQGEDDEKPRLLALAHELGLASVQISMAHSLGVTGRELDFARYPIPNWQPEGGYKVDPLLIFSLMKQESGFKQTAVSPVGALGLMQLMPQTASLMHKQMYGNATPPSRMSASEPILNITLGQNYVEHLLTNPMVEGNLFYLLAAYNAGPGRLQDWKASLRAQNDPLLFVESIPFTETRNYVMQVMTNYWIYSELIGGSDTSLRAVAKGQWPSYEAYDSLAAAKAEAANAKDRGV
ncbi:MAG: lytic transglycosylase domain-containing protein, partial [Rickettsiales bacterium]|nr:lytic transglycosylase domain-containing protein [Rickettsiales bacterium]